MTPDPGRRSDAEEPAAPRPPGAAGTPSPRRRLRWRHRWTVRLVLLAGLMAAVTFFVAANYVFVELRLVGWHGDVRLSWALLGASALGFVIGLVAPRLLR